MGPKTLPGRTVSPPAHPLPPGRGPAAPAALPRQSEIDRLLALYAQGQFAPLAGECQRLRRRYPRAAAINNILGAAALGLGDFAAAQSAFARAAAADPHDAEIRNNLGIALAAQDRLDAALAAYERAIALRPDYAEAHYNRGNALRRQGALAAAVQAYERALAIRPGYAAACNNLGLARQALDQLGEAAEAFGRALAIDPNYAEAHYNLGNVLHARQRPAEAIAAYRKALALRPDHAEAWSNLGLALHRSGDCERAAASYGKALSLKPDSVEALHNFGILLLEAQDFPAAIKLFDLVLKIQPEKADTLVHKLHAQAHICDFSAVRTFEAGSPLETPPAGLVPPFTMLALADDPALQLRCSRAWQANWPSAARALPAVPKSADGRIRIGYFSADFHSHATLCLMAGVFREHDRERFAISAYSYGPDSQDAMRAQLLRDVERFHDVRGIDDAEAARLARSHRLDIAVDLKGYTQQSRSRIFAHRAAPVQINYLGYPGTMGAGFIDYLIADGTVVPPDAERFCSEKIIRLPGCYQPNDDRRPIAEDGAGRAAHGLPEAAFVFCCFNHTYKISHRAFAIWMRLLARVDGSVLWLLRSNAWAEANLRREAARCGVDPARLVFAENLPHAQHLGRLRHADLFLDTFNVNAHTTASDALWAGLPVLTKAGRQFAARVCASLVRAVGLPELAVDSEAAYEALALELATSPTRLADLRACLAEHRLSHPLFDTAAYTRHLEAAYSAVHERHGAGLAPETFAIA